MFFELRQYRAKPGQREKWVKFMEEVIIPFQVSKGMVILAALLARRKAICTSGSAALPAKMSVSSSMPPCMRAISGRTRSRPRSRIA